LNVGGYVLDFTNARYKEFVYEATGEDLYGKYGLSKGKNLEAIVKNEPDALVGKLLLELLRYMREIGDVTTQNRELFNECAAIGNRLIGRVASAKDKPRREPATSSGSIDFARFLSDLTELSVFDDSVQARGYAFEDFLNRLFGASSLEPRGPFRIQGEQIDRSFVLRDSVYLLEAKWTSKLTNKAELVVFNEKVTSKSGFTRGLFVSYAGFSSDAVATFATGRTVSTVLATVQDIAVCLERRISVDEMIWQKVRALAEEGDFSRSVFDFRIGRTHA
jgi:hypothetical protein